MPSQSSNPFFRLMESEIPASPCSESAGSELSQPQGHDLARRVSFSPEASDFPVFSPLNFQKFANALATPVLKGAASSHLQVQQSAVERRVEISRSTSVFDSSIHVSTHHNLQKSTQQLLPQPHKKSPTESVMLRNQCSKSSQSNPGVPNYLSPGLAVSKQATLGTFAAATYSSPPVHSSTPRPRFSSHEGIA